MTKTETDITELQSEFGMGLTYCLGLFLAHAERLESTVDRYRELNKKHPDLFTDNSAVEIWFNAAADHLFELQCDSAPEHMRYRLSQFQDKCLNWRLSLGERPPAALDDAKWAIQEAKDLLRTIDESHGVPTCQGQWE